MYYFKNCESFLELNQFSNVYFCNNYSEKLSEFHIHDDLYINRAYYWY